MLFSILSNSNQHPGADAFHFPNGSTISYSEFKKQIESTASHLKELGVQPRDRVIVKDRDLYSFIVGVLACSKIDAVFVPVEHNLLSSKLENIILQTTPTAIFESLDFITPLTREPSPPVAAEISAIFFTSGSSGSPKGIPLTTENLSHVAKILSKQGKMHFGHRELLISRPSHMDGWQRLIATLFVAGTIYPGAIGTLSMILEECATKQINGVYIPPPVISHGFAGDLKIPDSLKTIELGSRKIPSQFLHSLQAAAVNTTIIYHYGLTECSRATILDLSLDPQKPTSCGKPVDGVKISIRSKTGFPLGPLERGEIWLSGPQCTRSYWSNASLTNERFEDTWFKTGDSGYVDGEGFLFFEGRNDDLISKYGSNFYPLEVEIELAKHFPNLPMAYIAYGSPPDQKTALFVESREDLLQHLQARLRSVLPAAQQPDQVILISEILKTSSGKIDRKALALRCLEEIQ